MSTTRMSFDDSRARQELGYRPRPAVEALSDSARWFVAQQKLVPARRAKIAWTDQPGRPVSPGEPVG